MLLGKALWMLTEDMFKKRVPDNGDILYKALQNLVPALYGATAASAIANTKSDQGMLNYLLTGYIYDKKKQQNFWPKYFLISVIK